MPFVAAILFILNSSHAQDTKGSEEVIKLFQKYHLGEPKISVKSNGRLQVIGYTKNEKQKKAIIKEIEKTELPITCTLYVDSILVTEINKVIKKSNFPIDAEYKGEGRFSLHGIVKKRRDVQNIIFNRCFTGGSQYFMLIISEI